MVDIDEGVFKYVLLKVQLDTGVTHLVRGRCMAKYHKDVAAPICGMLHGRGVRHQILGGGRINHDKDTKKIVIYGHSMGFPWENDECMHNVTADLCRIAFPNYEVSWSPEGY